MVDVDVLASWVTSTDEAHIECYSSLFFYSSFL